MRLLHYARSRQLLMLSLLGVVAACDDAPSAPRAYTHAADGEVWVAVTVPNGVPDVRTWQPYIGGAGYNGEQSPLETVRALQEEAERARRVGDLEVAREREELAIRTAAESITRTPGTVVLLSALAALDRWREQAEAAGDEGGFRDLQEAAEVVRAERYAALTALQQGDTASAVIHLTAASRRVRDFSPASVATRALARAERRIEERNLTDENAARALRLLRNAREALGTGDYQRAMRRALYALQLAEGAGK